MKHKKNGRRKKFFLTLIILVLFLFVIFILIQLYRVNWRLYPIESKFCIKSSQCYNENCCTPGYVRNIWSPLTLKNILHPQKIVDGKKVECSERDCDAYGCGSMPVECSFFLCGYKGNPIGRF
jgi:hypothetical protein